MMQARGLPMTKLKSRRICLRISFHKLRWSFVKCFRALPAAKVKHFVFVISFCRSFFVYVHLTNRINSHFIFLLSTLHTFLGDAPYARAIAHQYNPAVLCIYHLYFA